MRRLHVTFGPSSAGALIHALQLVNRDDEVVSNGDNLCVGRISSVEARCAWMWGVCDDDQYAEYLPDLREIWSRILDPDCAPVVWFSSRSAHEYLGLLELLSRRDPSTVRIVDVATAGLLDRSAVPWAAPRMGFVSHTQLARLLQAEHACEVPGAILDDVRELWPRLLAEDASVRVFVPGLGLASVPLDHFDRRLVAATPADTWKSQGWINGQVMGNHDDALDVGEAFLLDRLAALVEDGVLEKRDSDVEHQGWLLRRRV